MQSANGIDGAHVISVDIHSQPLFTDPQDHFPSGDAAALKAALPVELVAS